MITDGFSIEGKYADAKVFAVGVEASCVSQINAMCNHPAFDLRGGEDHIAIMPDTHAGKGSVIGFTMPLQDKIVPNVVGVDIGCFTGDTKVPTLSGVEYTLEELTRLEMPFYVYSVNKDGRIVPGKAVANKTRTNAKLMLVVVSGGHRIECTPDHKFMLLDGTYREAQRLKPSDSLMPLYRTYQTRDGYEMILNQSGTARLTHKLVAEYTLGPCPDGHVVHHKNGMWFDNRPGNLEHKDKHKHGRDHARKKSGRLQSDGFKQHRLLTLQGKGFYDPALYGKKAAVGTKNILRYMNQSQEEWREKIKDNGKRGAKHLAAFNKRNNSTVFTCDCCGREVKGKGGFVRHTNACNGRNHKVLFTQLLEIRGDVYCLTVEEHHNFALSAGVFVHNCGMAGTRFRPRKHFELAHLDGAIRERVPTGFHVREDSHSYGLIMSGPGKLMAGPFWDGVNSVQFQLWDKLKKTRPDAPKPPVIDTVSFRSLCGRVGMSFDRAQASLGTLGGGNHFIELGKVDGSNDHWLVVHCGSRQLGEKICRYWQKKAIENRKAKLTPDYEREVGRIRETTNPRSAIPKAIKALREKMGLHNMKGSVLDFLEGDDFYGYLWDMVFAQAYAEHNRKCITRDCLKIMGVKDSMKQGFIDTVHNYIDFGDLMIRKGAIRAHAGDQMILPFNMRDGTLICEGLGNEEWNRSAPHGAGRLFSRREAKDTLSLSDAKKQMEGIYTSVLPIDEAPGAYKPAEVIEAAIGPTAKIIERVKPILNIKAG